MNRRGFLRAAVAAGLALAWRNPVVADELLGKGNEKDRGALIRAALRDHRLVEFRYHEHTRRAEPHALGRLKDGRIALLAWQVAGSSRSGPPPGWRNFLLTEIEAMRIAEEKFAPRSDYRPEKTRFNEILVEITP